MALDMETGLDPPRIKIRAAQGLEAADFFMPGFWVWVSKGGREGRREGGGEGGREGGRGSQPENVTHIHTHILSFLLLLQVRLIRDFAAIGYDRSDVALQSYDWRLSRHTQTHSHAHKDTNTHLSSFLLSRHA